MFRSLLLFAALLPEARAADEITIRVLDVEIALPTESSTLPESVAIGFSAPDSLTVEVHARSGGGYGILLFDTTSSMNTVRSAHDWWSLCLAGRCPPIEVEVGSLAAEYEAAPSAAGSLDPEWKYVPVRRTGSL